jgi:hypothetical protein
MKKKSVKKKKSSFYDDDNCPVCRAMRKAEEEEREPSLEEIEDAFEEAALTNPHAGTGEDLMDEDELEPS